MVLDALLVVSVAYLYYLRRKDSAQSGVNDTLTKDFPGRSDDVLVPPGEDRRDYVAWWRENEAWYNMNKHDPRIDPDWLRASDI